MFKYGVVLLSIRTSFPGAFVVPVLAPPISITILMTVFRIIGSQYIGYIVVLQMIKMSILL